MKIKPAKPQPDLKERVAALNRQVADLQKLNQDLAAAKKLLETARDDEKVRMQKRLIALQQDLIAYRQGMDRKLAIELDKSRAMLKAIEESQNRFKVLNAAVERMREKLGNGIEPSPACKKYISSLAEAVHNKRYDAALALVDDAKAKGIKSDDIDPDVLGLAILVLSGKPTDKAAELANKILAKTLDKATVAPDGSVRKADAATDSSDPFGGAGATKPDMPKADSTKPADTGDPFGP